MTPGESMLLREAIGAQHFSYDAYGNLVDRTTATSEGATQVNTPADPQTNRLEGAVTYDAEGNMTGWNGAQYDFDALGQMVRMRNGNQDWLFAYSTGGERILQVAEGGTGEKRWTVRDVAGRVLREWVEPALSAPVWTRDWIYRGSQLLATVEPPPQALLDQGEGETSQATPSAPLSSQLEVTRHLTLDHLGTPRLVTDEAGTNLAFHIYWPYGREASDPLQNELRKKFTGHERDSYDLSSLADELDYMRFRLASPLLGRFLSMDGLHGDAQDLQSWNAFSYVRGNPATLSDPMGLQPIYCIDGTCYDSVDARDGDLCSLFGLSLGGCTDEGPRSGILTREFGERARDRMNRPDDPGAPPPPPSPPGDPSEPFDEESVKDFFHCLLAKAGYGSPKAVEWGGSTRKLDRGGRMFKGNPGGRRHAGMPKLEEADALVHTHPNDTNDGFNPWDRGKAEDELIPSYVVKRNGVWKFTPGSGGAKGTVEQVAFDRWYEDLPGDPCSRLVIY